MIDLATFRDDAREWARGRMWIPRALLLAYLVYAEIKFLRDPLSSSMFSGITLAFHEMGHLIFSLFELATYIGDARAMELPLVGFTSDPEHDWHYLLSTMGLLGADTFLAFLTRVAATVIGAVSLAFAVWLLLVMAGKKFQGVDSRSRRSTPPRRTNL